MWKITHLQNTDPSRVQHTLSRTRWVSINAWYRFLTFIIPSDGRLLVRRARCFDYSTWFYMTQFPRPYLWMVNHRSSLPVAKVKTFKNPKLYCNKVYLCEDSDESNDNCGNVAGGI